APEPPPEPAAPAAADPSLVPAAAAPEAAPEPPSKWAKCEAPPVGMACIPGGAAVIGDDHHDDKEKPRHSVEVSTFYLDKNEVTNKQYEDCEKAKACPKRPNVDPAFLAADLPAVPVSWPGARAYCIW